MEIFLYDTSTKQKKRFKPLNPGRVSIYACGVTVYDLCHIGHARGPLVADILRRLLISFGNEVFLVKNYTDIDDKIIERSQKLGITPDVLTQEMIQHHDKDIAALFIAPADEAPKATQHIEEMLSMISSLIVQGYAYESKGDVYFSVRDFPEYGKLSGKNIEQLASGARVEINVLKRDPLDFVLWKSSKPGEPMWESPWGLGRPGWHIECSAMAKKYLGKHFDIHLGGSDLIFPHHENEIAQSEACNQSNFVNYWLHNGMIQVSGEKMSKSLDNSAIISELLKKFHPELLRFYLLSGHYRHNIQFSHELVRSQLEGLDRIYMALQRFLEEEHISFDDFTKMRDQDIDISPFLKPLCDDLNTPGALGALFGYAKELNIANHFEKKKQAASCLYKSARILGLFNSPPEEWARTVKIQEGDAQGFLGEANIEAMIAKRLKAREEKDWVQADMIRKQLDKAGVKLLDGREGTSWSRKR